MIHTRDGCVPDDPKWAPLPLPFPPMSRICARPGCNAVATATLSYAYRESVVWIDALSETGHPMTHDLCPDHAESLRVPRGWQRQDRRDAVALHTVQARLLTA